MRSATDPAAITRAAPAYGIARDGRVIDASVMPTVTSTNTNPPTIAIAEEGRGQKLAEVVKASRVDGYSDLLRMLQAGCGCVQFFVDLHG